MSNDHLLIKEIQSQFELPVVIGDLYQMEQALAEAINEMILHHYDRLIQLLYRMDINEKKLKTLLQEHPQTDAGRIIAALVIEREQQKIASREASRENRDDAGEVDGSERW